MARDDVVGELGGATGALAGGGGEMITEDDVLAKPNFSGLFSGGLRERNIDLVNTPMSPNLKDLLDDNVRTAVLEGDYSLLLGAGASFGARSADGHNLPMGDSFASELTRKYSLNIRSGTPLQQVWDAAVFKAGSEGELRQAALAPRFSQCVPAKYHFAFSSFIWHRIFSFNVDDALVVAYEGNANRLQDLTEVHFEDQYVDAEPAADRLQFIYLHGSAGMTNRKVVFSPPAYADAIKAQNTWFHVFAESFLSNPFIVIGASLREPDFETYLAHKTRFPNPLAPPSFYVDPNIDDAARAVCQRLGLVPVELTGEEFLTQLSNIVGFREKNSARLAKELRPLTLLGALDVHLAAVAEQFLLVPRDSSRWPNTDRAAEAFYEGFDPMWDDIRAMRDVALQFEADLAQEIRSFLDSSESGPLKITVISDSAGTGKTTIAMRVAGTLAVEGRPVLYSIGTDRLKDEALLSILAREKNPIVLVIDRLAAHSLPVARIISGYPKNGPRCFILGVERRTHESSIRERLRISPSSFRDVPSLALPEIEDLVRKLRSAAKLGRYAGKSDVELAAIFSAVRDTAWAGQLLVLLLDVTQEKKLIERLVDEWNSLPPDGKMFYGAVCLASACGFPLRSARAYATMTIDSVTVFSKSTLNGPLQGLLRWERDGGDYYVRPRHRIIAEETVRKCMTDDEVFRVSLAVGAALAPYMNRATVKSGSPDARLMRQIMDADGLIVPRFGSRGEEWFADLQPQCGWNSRYWEQRALHAMKQRNRKRARDFASTGVGIERHFQPMTTYARILIDSAENDKELSFPTRQEYFREGLDLLEEAILAAAAHRRHDVHPYHLLFEVAVRVVRKIAGKIPDWLEEVLRKHAPQADKYFGHRREIFLALRALREMGVI